MKLVISLKLYDLFLKGGIHVWQQQHRKTLQKSWLMHIGWGDTMPLLEPLYPELVSLFDFMIDAPGQSLRP